MISIKVSWDYWVYYGTMYVIIWLIIKMIIEVNYTGLKLLRVIQLKTIIKRLLRVYINFKRVIKGLFLFNY